MALLINTFGCDPVKVSLFKRGFFLCFVLSMSAEVFAYADDNDWAVASNSVKINQAELRVITSAMLKTGQIPSDKLSTASVERAAKDFILYKTLAVHAQDLGLDKIPEVQKILEMSQQNMLGAAYLENYLEKLKLPDFEAIAFEKYTLNKKEFVQLETVNAQHILITLDDGDDEKAQRFAAELREKIVSEKQDFSEVAKQYSQDPTVIQNNGNLGFFDKNQMVAEFSNMAFTLKVGEVSEPVKTQFGWHVIKVLDKKPERQLDFSEVKERLINSVKQDFIREERSKKINEILNASELHINEDMIKSIVNDLSNIE